MYLCNCTLVDLFISITLKTMHMSMANHEFDFSIRSKLNQLKNLNTYIPVIYVCK